MTHRQHATHRTGLIALPLLGTVLLAISLRVATAQVIGDAAAGHDLAQTWCSTCHVIDPAPRHASDMAAPSFAAIAAMPSTTPMALSVFLQTPHAAIPDLHLSRDEIDDLTAYILSLRRK